MINMFYTTTLFCAFIVSFLLCWLLVPLLIRLSPWLGLVDKPNNRKVHRQLIPAIGGLTIVLAVSGTAFVYAPLQALLQQHASFAMALLVLSVTGVVDDRLNIPAPLRLLIQVGCAVAVANGGIQLTSLHGVLGLTDLPPGFRYGLTVLILTGMANAFNLIDGIDGLAGSLALVNCGLLSVLAVVVGHLEWLALLLPLGGALTAFLKFNWRPARLFMGDGGSVVLGFLTAALGILFVEDAYRQPIRFAPQVVVLVVASCMIPIVDALRVFGKRIGQGNSPFSADQNHIHHWFLKHRFAHSQITTRLVSVHTTLVGLSFLLSFFLSISSVLIFQVVSFAVYTACIQFSYLFLISYRLVKNTEKM